MILARKIARVGQVGGQVGEDRRACPARKKTGSTTAVDCQLFLWQAERTTRRHSCDDPREDVGVGVRVGPVEFQLITTLDNGDENKIKVVRRSPAVKCQRQWLTYLSHDITIDSVL